MGSKAGVSKAGMGRAAYFRGVAAEAAAGAALVRDGWSVLAQRLRTPAGEIDLVAEKSGLLAFIEVKARPDLATAALSLRPRQCQRLMQAAEIVMAEHPDWGTQGARFDVLLVDAAGRVRRVVDAFRQES